MICVGGDYGLNCKIDAVTIDSRRESVTMFREGLLTFEKSIERLGIPSITVADGPHGLKKSKEEEGNGFFRQQEDYLFSNSERTFEHMGPAFDRSGWKCAHFNHEKPANSYA